MNIDIKPNQKMTITLSNSKEVEGKFNGFSVINQLPHLVLCETDLEKDSFRLIPVTQILIISFDQKLSTNSLQLL